MRKTVLLFILALVLTTNGFSVQQKEMKEPVDYVNPYMGNISHLLVPTFPTVHLPNSMLRVYPERRDFTEIEISGLPLVVTSHRGSSAFNLSTFQGNAAELKPVIAYRYDHEKITPYGYSVYLDRQQTQVNFGVSHQSAVYEFTFQKDDDVYLILNSRNGALNWDGTAVSGYQQLANNTRIYLYFVPDAQPDEVKVLKGNQLVNGTAADGKNACLVLRFPANTRSLVSRYGISFIEESQARKNMEREVQGKTLADVQAEGRNVWN